MKKYTIFVTFRSRSGDEHETMTTTWTADFAALKEKLSKQFHALMTSENVIKLKTTSQTDVFIRTEEIIEILVDYYETKEESEENDQ